MKIHFSEKKPLTGENSVVEYGMKTYEALVYLNNGDDLRTIVAAKNAMDAADYLLSKYSCKRIKLWELRSYNEPGEPIYCGEFF